MLTPAFELTQDGRFLHILIKVPFAKVADTEIFVEENDFKFFSKPYFLRLNLPGNIVENGQEKAEYNYDKGEFSLTFPKETPGEIFEGLDMITKLLAPKGSSSASQPLIEVVGESSEEVTEKTVDVESDCDEDGHVTVDEDFDWTIDQAQFVEPSPLLCGSKYGFASQKSGIFQRLQEELCGVVDCPDPDNMTPGQRRETRMATEDDKFDAQHYLGDMFEDEVIQALIQYVGPWSHQLNSVAKDRTPVELEVELTDEEKETMRKLPNKEYLLDIEEETAVYLGLVDILFAYTYNYRVFEGETNAESGWNISKLSATLSWLEVYTSLQEVIITSYRRCLCYPLYRHWQLCNTIVQDIVTIFKTGKRCVLKCLLDVRSSLMDTESRYVLNDLYITDYCVWIQHASDTKLKHLSQSLEKINISKDDISFNLVDIEQLAQSAMESGELDDVTGELADLLVEPSDSEGSDPDSGDTDSDDSSDDDSESVVTTDSEEETDTYGKNTAEPRGNGKDNTDIEDSRKNGLKDSNVQKLITELCDLDIEQTNSGVSTDKKNTDVEKKLVTELCDLDINQTSSSVSTDKKRTDVEKKLITEFCDLDINQTNSDVSTGTKKTDLEKKLVTELCDLDINQTSSSVSTDMEKTDLEKKLVTELCDLDINQTDVSTDKKRTDVGNI